MTVKDPKKSIGNKLWNQVYGQAIYIKEFIFNQVFFSSPVAYDKPILKG
jgi:hypothetical protein